MTSNNQLRTFLTLAFAVLATLAPAALANAEILFTEDFEFPDVTAAQSTGFTNMTTPPDWVRQGGAFGANRHGLVDKASGAFFAPAGNDQAYGLRYTASPGITSAEGVIGAIAPDVTYTLTFDVQQDLGDPSYIGGTADADYYSAELIAYDVGADRVQYNVIDGTLLDSAFGNVPTDGQFHTITFDWTAPAAGDPLIGLDLGVRFNDVWAGGNSRASGVIDNVVVSNDVVNAVPEPTSIAIWYMIGLSLAGFGYRRMRRKK